MGCNRAAPDGPGKPCGQLPREASRQFSIELQRGKSDAQSDRGRGQMRVGKGRRTGTARAGCLSQRRRKRRQSGWAKTCGDAGATRCRENVFSSGDRTGELQIRRAAVLQCMHRKAFAVCCLIEMTRRFLCRSLFCCGGTPGASPRRTQGRADRRQNERQQRDQTGDGRQPAARGHGFCVWHLHLFTLPCSQVAVNFEATYSD